MIDPAAGTKSALRLAAGNNNNYAGNNQILMSYAGGTSYTNSIRTRHNSGTAGGNAIDFYAWTPADAATAVGTKHVMSLDGTGGVGIGTNGATPNGKLDVRTNTGQGFRIINGTNGDPTISSFTGNASIFTRYIAEGPMAFFAGNTDPGTGSSADPGIYVTAGNNVGMGTTAVSTRLTVAPPAVSLGSIPSGWGGGIHTFDMYAIGTIGAGDGSGTGPGNLRAYLNSTGNIFASGCVQYSGSTLGTCASDARTKKDVQPFSLGLKDLLEVNPVYYRYTGEYGQKADGTKMVGVIAQDLERAIPELVKPIKAKRTPASQEEEIKSVNYSWFNFMTINAVKELYKKLTGVDERVAKLEAENAAQARELASLKAKLQKNDDSVSELKALFCADHPSAKACRK